MRPSNATADSGRWYSALLAISFAAIALTVFSVRMPPLLDHPQHLVRFWLLAGGIQNDPLSSMFVLDWSRSQTNIGSDLLAYVFARYVPIEWFASLIVLLSAALPPLGAILLNRALFGGFHWWHVAITSFAFSFTFMMGFVNSQISLGVALLAASLEPRLAVLPIWQACVVRAVLGAVTLVCHLFGFGFYVLLVAGLAYGPALLSASRRELLQRGLVTFYAAGAALAPGIVYFWILAGRTLLAREGAWAWEGTIYSRLTWLLSPITSYEARVEILIVVVMVSIVVLAWRAGRLAIHGGLVLTSIALLLLSMFAPTSALGDAMVSMRFPIMAGLSVCAALRPELDQSRASAWALPFAITVAICLRCLWIAGIWAMRQTDITSAEKVLAHVPAGSAVITVEQPIEISKWRDLPASTRGRFVFGGMPTYWGLGALAVMQRKSFALIFAVPGKQPVRALPPWDEITVEAAPWYAEHLRDNSGPKPQVLKVWRQRFTHVLELNADVGKPQRLDVSIPGLEFVADEGFARLYRVVPSQAESKRTDPQSTLQQLRPLQ